MAKKYTKGFDGLSAAMDRLPVQILELCRTETYRSAETVRTNVVADIRIQKLPPGVKPVAGPGRRKHIPSPPYGPPNADTGNLMGRYGVAVGHQVYKIFSLVIAGVRYAQWLEYGTSRMLPRPHLSPRFNEESPRFRRRLREGMAAVKQNFRQKR